jgi:isocitrate/isopropylmalate dehydrogenase
MKNNDIAEILLKVALNTLNQTKPIKKTAESIEKSKNLLFDLALVIRTDIYKQNNSNSTIGFRNKQMLFLNLFPMKNIYKYHKQIYMHADLNFKLVRIIYTLREKKKFMNQSKPLS